jgi:hypothetical protein
MHKWWWWVQWLHAKWKLEKRRVKALSIIEGERVLVEETAQRPRQEGDPFDCRELFNTVIPTLDKSTRVPQLRTAMTDSGT